MPDRRRPPITACQQRVPRSGTPQRRWEARPPRSAPGAGFGQLEVMQRELVDGRAVLLFSCLRPELSAARAATVRTGGVWAVTAPPGNEPFDVATARLLLDDRFYVGRLVRDHAGRHRSGHDAPDQWMLLAFHNRGPDSTFVGEISDPMPVGMTPEGLRLA